MESNNVTVCRLVPDDWQAYRSIRLAMLQESPSAFASTYSQTATLDEPAWRQRLTDTAVFLSKVDGTPAGSAMYSVRDATGPGDCGLFGMWVDPTFRRGGVGQALVEAVIAQARAAAKRRVVLHVVAKNAGARSFYKEQGFVATGRSAPHPNGDLLLEVEMELVLDDDRRSAADI